jgi:hypothetical protein
MTEIRQDANNVNRLSVCIDALSVSYKVGMIRFISSMTVQRSNFRSTGKENRRSLNDGDGACPRLGNRKHGSGWDAEGGRMPEIG